MKDKTLERANEIKKEMKALKEIRQMMFVPYPYIHTETIDRVTDNVCFISLVKENCEKLKKMIQEFCEIKCEELDKEFKEL